MAVARGGGRGGGAPESRGARRRESPGKRGRGEPILPQIGDAHNFFTSSRPSVMTLFSCVSHTQYKEYPAVYLLSTLLRAFLTACDSSSQWCAHIIAGERNDAFVTSA